MRFSIALSMIMDGTAKSRAEWAEALEVSKPAISQWLTGKTIPRPEHLAAIVGIIRSDPKVSKETKARVGELLTAPTSELFSKPPGYIGPTLSHYMVKPVREVALKMLDELEPGQQYEALTELAERCRTMKDPVTAVLD
jgi:transcriptional regulator with XRE-family HTH domain